MFKPLSHFGTVFLLFCPHGVFSLCRKNIRKRIHFLLLKLGCERSKWPCLSSFALIPYLSSILSCFLKDRFQVNVHLWRFLGQKILLCYYVLLWFNFWDSKIVVASVAPPPSLAVLGSLLSVQVSCQGAGQGRGQRGCREGEEVMALPTHPHCPPYDFSHPSKD